MEYEELAKEKKMSLLGAGEGGGGDEAGENLSRSVSETVSKGSPCGARRQDECSTSKRHEA